MTNIDQTKVEQFRNREINLAQLFDVDAKQVAALLITGHTFFSEGRLDEAKAIFEGLSVLDGRNPYVHSILGAIYQKQGKDDVAIARYTLALSLWDKDPNSLTNRGEIYLKLGRFNEAANDFKRAMDLDPNRKNPAANRARLLVTMTADALKLAKEKGVSAVFDAKKRIDEQLSASA